MNVWHAVGIGAFAALLVILAMADCTSPATAARACRDLCGDAGVAKYSEPERYSPMFCECKP